MKEIELASTDELRGWDRKWEAVATVLSKRYFVLEDDTPTAGAWIEKHLGESYRVGYRNARVAKIASPDEEKKYTVTKIDLAYTIELARRAAEAKKRGVEWSAPEEPLPIDLAALRYEVVRDGVKKRVGLQEVTPLELRAIQSKTTREGGVKSPTASAALSALRTQFTAKKGLAELTASERDHTFTVANVRRDQFVALGKALVAMGDSDE